MTLAPEFESVQLADMMFSSALGFLYYDHLLTLDAEIRLIWTRPKNTSRYLFFFNRYFAFVGNILAAISLYSTPFSMSVCRTFELCHSIFLTLTQGLVTSLLALRVYALYGCNKIFLFVAMGGILLGIFASVTIAIINKNSPSESTTSYEQGCHVLESHTEASHTAIAWECIVVLDTLLFLATLWKAYQYRLRPDVARLGVSLFAVVVRDGSIYFLIMASLNLVNIISYYTPGRVQGNLASFVSCLSVTLMSRMMLGLHEAADGGIYTNHHDDNAVLYNSSAPGLDAAWVNRAYTH
ncbi:hypothetical protein D9757_009081 [Collybiopsis confluens]|uniref:DUF6533 domain-containing protein n=1 Tax=Collybiopsis confluens TaxID=2823264 RepID=A0A8H5HE06_9AGAR|nr:hypothetical protein D9757_009081 [Collybiopsis confluens]